MKPLLTLSATIFAGMATSLPASMIISVTDLTPQSTVKGSGQGIRLDGVDISSNTVISSDVFHPSGGAINETSQTQTFSITGLTLDGVGSNDDSVTFSVMIEAFAVTADAAVPSISLGSAAALLSATGQWGSPGPAGSVASNSAVNRFGPGEGVRLSYVSGSVSLGAGALESYNILFSGFDEFTYDPNGSGNAVVVSMDGAATAIATPDTKIWEYDLEQAEVAIIGTETGNGFRLGALDFSLSIEAAAIPEPSSATVIMGILGLTFIARRRRLV